METIFDYDPTEKELSRFGMNPEYGDMDEQKKRFLKYSSEDHHNYCLHILFSGRKDKQRADAYHEKLTGHYLSILVEDF